MCILVSIVEFGGCGCVGRRAMDQCPDAAAMGSEFAVCARAERETMGVDSHPDRYCRLCAVAWLRDQPEEIGRWHRQLRAWADSYPIGSVPMDYYNGLHEAIEVIRTEVFAWAISQILA